MNHVCALLPAAYGPAACVIAQFIFYKALLSSLIDAGDVLSGDVGKFYTKTFSFKVLHGNESYDPKDPEAV